MEVQETQFGSPAPSKEKRTIHFSSGETLELEDSEDEEEQSSHRPPFTEPTERTRLSFKTLALLVGRISLLTCDFLGERLAGALGLNAAKYQYAIDQYHHQKTSREATNAIGETQAETAQLARGQDKNQYGATHAEGRPTDPQDGCAENHREEHRHTGYHNKGYEVDEGYFKSN
ncbi:Protein FAM177A1 [Channa argus]|uniref:Protein FAM177A1 n=1 Tax=Channa argus TaxID=215402 RepID=A0A6G1QJ45_CHAAH|nr:Protein FAM177A1 [Channa argus]KAK2890442.1 hypothetical protein Q8A73_018742 [Channa argus]